MPPAVAAEFAAKIGRLAVHVKTSLLQIDSAHIVPRQGNRNVAQQGSCESISLDTHRGCLAGESRTYESILTERRKRSVKRIRAVQHE